MRWKPSPATVLAGAALFFALGGTALAVSDAVQTAGALHDGRGARDRRRHG